MLPEFLAYRLAGHCYQKFTPSLGLSGGHWLTTALEEVTSLTSSHRSSASLDFSTHHSHPRSQECVCLPGCVCLCQRVCHSQFVSL